jgi:DNA topoisomerase-1
MEVKYSRKGGRFLGCTGYPECKNTLDYPSQDPEEPEEGEMKCEKCGRPMVQRTGRYGPFMGCSGYPRCKNTCKVPKDNKN